MENIHQLKILVCEEDSRILSRLESWIKAIGGEAIINNNGVSALEIFKEEKPDIILIAQELKNMGGIELLEKIKKIEPNQATILMLSDDYGNVFKRAIDLQVDKYLNKPVEAKQLFSAIESLSQEKVWHQEFLSQKRMLKDYKDAIDLTFSVSRHDKDGNVIYVNDLFCTTTKIRHSDAMKGMINPLNNKNEDMKIVWDALRTDLLYKDRQIFKLDDLSERIIDVTAVALLNEQEEVSEYLVFLDDVTDIIHAARKIKNQELDNRLDKLNHVRELNSVKDSFLTIFTHELKTPLNSIINFSEYVVKHLAKEEFAKREKLEKQVQEINKSGYFMLDMITNLMEAMKLKDSNIELNIAKVELTNLLSFVVACNKTQDVKVSLHYEDSLELDIFTDETRLKQIFTNITSNAIKYASSKVDIFIEMTAESFIVEITDDGKGFTDTEHVFDIFEQSDANSMTREASGTGVGLYIVKQLCDRMSYKIELLSSEVLGGAKVIVKGQRDIRI